MRRIVPYIFVVGITALLGLGFLIGRWTGSPESAPVPAASIEMESSAPEQWTCSMHPQIQTLEPGDCPICAMDLIPVEKDSGSELGPRAMTMSENALALAQVETSKVVRAFPEAGISLVGSLELDETRVRSLTARFPARIDELFVNYTGAPVNQGEHLAMVYSPELSTAQHELLMAHNADPDGSLALSAREKLRLWDLLPDQIEAILERGEATDHFELRAPVGGVVVIKNVNEGDYVQTGEPLFKIADISTLWLFLDAYESDLPWLRFGQEVAFTVEAWPGETFTGQIAFIEPELDRMTRTVAVRVNVPNEDGRLKPGMFARGTVKARIAEGGNVHAPDMAGKWISPMHPEIVKDAPGSCDVCGMDLVPAESLGYVDLQEGDAPLVIPTSAVLRTGKRAVVYVQLEGFDKPTFEGREIVLGPRAGDVFIVKEGLDEGERVVTRGAFKIDSALQIQAKPSMMNPDGGVAMTGHEGHGPGGSHDHPDQTVAEIALHIEPTLAATLMADYFALQSAMADDNFEGSLKALKAMMGKTGHVGALPDLIHVMLASSDMDALRRPHFDTLSTAFIEAVQADPSAFTGDIYLMSCPMVYDGRDDNSADWLQNHDKLLNPFWGDVMLRCGESKGKLR